MLSLALLSLLGAYGAASAQETVLGAYIFHRHGDRTAKSTPPTNLTGLGYQQVYTSGSYYRTRYIASDAVSKIKGMNTDIVKQSQISVSSPLDTVLQNSAQAFLQGLYPPVGSQLGTSTLHNGTEVSAPLDGYQLIPIAIVSSGTSSEDSAWLQGSTNCKNAQISSNSYFTSAEYMDLLDSTQDFYNGLAPMINRTFDPSQTSFRNAYTIFDLLNVANIDNGTFPSQDLLTDDVLFQLRILADAHEWGLAYNTSEPIRAVSGSTLAAQVVTALNGTIAGAGKNKLNIQFGAYASFLSYFGLANLPQASQDFQGVPDYASSMVWELVTNASVDTFPSADDISVRFYFHNGTTSNISEPVPYPLFGGSSNVLSWNDFVTESNKFAIHDQAGWCKACGNTTGVCQVASTTSDTGGSETASSTPRNGMSNAVAGVIGAMVALAVILGVEILVLLLGGLRVVRKQRLAGVQTTPPATTEASKTA